MTSEAPTLLCPGPVKTSAAVRRALAESDYSHRDPAFRGVVCRVSATLAQILDADGYDVLLLGGGGTSATEAALATFVAPGEEILVASNGAFGERIAEMVGVLQVRVHHLRYGWGDPILLTDLERELEAHPETRAVAMVHHETSVGILNPVREVGRLLAESGVHFFVDAVSSIGAEELSVSRGHIDTLIGSANKCLHGIPGVSFVLVRKDCWDVALDVPARSLFLDLRRYREALDRNEASPFTPPVAAIVALDRALRELVEAGGPEFRRRHYRVLNERVREGLQALGLQPSNGTRTSCSMTLARLPEGAAFDEFYRGLRELGFVIYPAKGPFRGTHFIVANMGDLNLGSIEAFLEAAEEVVGAATVGGELG